MPEPRDLFVEEKRVQLDGGLNTEASPLAVDTSQVVEAFNFRTGKRGSVELRDGALPLFTLNYPIASAGSLTVNNRIVGPVLELVAGGTFPEPQTYTARIFHTGWNGNIGASNLNTSAAPILTNPANRSIKVKIPALNLGEGAGQASPAVDDPLMLGYLKDYPYVFIESTANPNVFYYQGFVAFTWSLTDLAWTATLTSFNTGFGTMGADTVFPQAIRKIYSHNVGDLAIVVSADRTFQFPTFQAVSAANEWHIPTDKNGNLYYTARSAGAPVDIAEAVRVMVLCDGFRPKKSSIGDGASGPLLFPTLNNRWVMLGANPPSAVPTVADTGAGAAFAAGNVYTYRQTNIYRHSRVLDRHRTEFWYSESAPVQSATHTVVAANTNITVTFASSITETNLYKKRLYRSVNHSATPTAPGRFYRLSDSDPATATYVDSVADATINVTGRKTDPDDEGKTPLDVPPASSIFPIEHDTRIWVIVGQPITSYGDNRVLSFVGRPIARMSLQQKEVYLDPNGTDTDLIEQTIDAFPDDTDHTVVLGGSGQVSGWLSYRGRILVFKTMELGVITGTVPGNYTYDVLYKDIGAIQNSIINVQGVIFFWNADKGPYQYDGQTYKWIGDNIGPTWKTYRDAGYWCQNVIHDRVTSEVRWSFTNAAVHPGTSAGSQAAGEGTWLEFVYHAPSSSWWLFNGVAGNRVVRAAGNLQTQNLANPMLASQRMVFGDNAGRIQQDHSGYKDGTTQAIVGTITFRLFGYLDDFNWVKVFKYISTLYTMGAISVGSVKVWAKTSESALYGEVMTLATSTVGEKMQIGDIPSPVSAGDNKTQDRGLWIKIESSVDASFIVNALLVEYQRITHQRRAI